LNVRPVGPTTRPIRRVVLGAALVVLIAAGAAVAIGLTQHHHQPARADAPVAGEVGGRHPPASPPVLVAGARWQRAARGYRLRVRPSDYGRNHALSAPPTALAQALAAARPTPLPLTASIRQALTNQLRCHAEFAPTKAGWNLETWRPDVSYEKTVLALCNP
jgi:Protein of unknown function (DUF2599)